ALFQDSRVRIAAWTFVVCTLLCGVAVFLPAAELRVDGSAISKRASLSLYRASTSKELVHAFVRGYRHVRGRGLGEALASELMPHLRSDVRGHVGDVRDAMTTLDDVDERDVVTLGHVLTATVWTLLGVLAVMGIIVFNDTMRGEYRRWRAIAAVVLSAIAAAIT